MPPERFLGLEGKAYLYTGAEGPAWRQAEAVLGRYLRARAEGEAGRAQHHRVELECRALLARLAGGRAADYTFLASASDALNTVAEALQLREGENVVTDALEFPSVYYPWLARRPAVELRVVPHRGWRVTLADLEAATDRRTRVLAVSHVSYLSGYRHNLAALADLARRRGAALLLDATQSLGVVPVEATACDFLVASSYKWLLGPHGAGVLYVHPERWGGLRPARLGWRSARDIFGPRRFEEVALKDDAQRFQPGYPSYPTLYALHAALPQLLEVGIERIAEHVLALGGALIAGLRALGLEVMTPEAPAERAGNVAWRAADGAGVARALAARGVHVWGGDGRVRASLHLFNGSADVDRLLQALRGPVP